MGEKPPQKVAKIIIGYRTRPVANLEKVLPEFKAPAHFKDPSKIADDIAYKKESFLVYAKDMPYTGTFDEVFLVDPKHNKVVQWSHQATEEDNKPPVAVRVRNYLVKHYPAAWANDTHCDRKQPEAIFIGFSMRNFLKMLGLECSTPGINKACPLGLWYSNVDHRDIGEAVLPSDYKLLTLPYVLKFRRPLDLTAAKHWDELTLDWPGPGVFPERDALITVELATQLGLLVPA